MLSKYFTIEVKPTIPVTAVAQDLAYTNGDIAFDWTKFEIPRGPAKLICLTYFTRGKDHTNDNTDNISLLYAKTINGQAPSTLGTVDNSFVDNFGWQNNVIGFSSVNFTTNNGPNLQGALMMHGNREHDDNLVLTGEPNSGSTKGLDELYIAGIYESSGTSFSTTVLARGGVTADGSVATLDTDAGSDDNPRAEQVFAPGDVIHTVANGLVGTIKSIAAFSSNKQVITFESPIANDVADNAELFNINPMRILLHFEK